MNFIRGLQFDLSQHTIIASDNSQVVFVNLCNNRFRKIESYHYGIKTFLDFSYYLPKAWATESSDAAVKAPFDFLKTIGF